jgi:hypothetical protein
MHSLQRRSIRSCVLAVVASSLIAALSASAQQDPLLLDAKAARELALSTRVNGQVGGSFDFRVTGTDRSYNYKLRATWLTSDVIGATARLLQLNQHLSDEQTQALVAEAERAGDTVILVEIHPREGSGIIPNDWSAFLRPRGAADNQTVTGTNTPKLRDLRALAGAAPRDYAYDVFWVVFPLRTSNEIPLFRPEDREAELVVQIYNKAGRVHWPIPESIRQRMAGQ